MENKAILEKIRKLMTLADTSRGATEAEAMTAMAKAQALLAEYGLSMAQVDSIEPGSEEPTIEGSLEAGRSPWKRRIMFAIGRLCFCDGFYSGRMMTLVGKPHDIAAAKSLALYVIATAEKLVKQCPADRGYRHSWKVGFARRISERCAVLRVTPIVSESTGKELAVIPLYKQRSKENAAYIEDHHGKLQSVPSRTTITNGDGYRAGQAAGSSVSLSRNNLGSDSTKRIG